LSGAGQIGALGNKDGSTGLFGTLYNGLFGKSSSPPPTPITNINDYSGYGGAFGSRGA
jgi:hypothetical protein